jgi:23S rRNA (cytosine1962-C5)-methyltransferase
MSDKAIDRSLALLLTNGPSGYALLDSGNGRKLERFGSIVVDRPEVQAMWQPRLPRAEWAKAHAVFSASGEDEEKGRWRVDKPVPEAWRVDVEGVQMLCRLAGLWHLGLFPEQVPHWQWMVSGLAKVSDPPGLTPGSTSRAGVVPGGAHTQPRVLNLFAYTGAASLIAAKAGAGVVHVDASKKAVAWARENAAASGLADAPVRWICEDARKFVAREVRRGRTYHSILLDPPKFGRGPDGEVWDLFEHLPALLSDCVKLLAPAGAHLVLTAYAIRASSLALDGLMREKLDGRAGVLESGELALAEINGGRLIGTSLFSRWGARDQ